MGSVRKAFWMSEDPFAPLRFTSCHPRNLRLTRFAEIPNFKSTAQSLQSMAHALREFPVTSDQFPVCGGAGRESA